MDDRFAVYDEYETKLKGGFATEQEAEMWLVEHPVYDVYDGEEEHAGEAHSEFEVRRIIEQMDEFCTYRVRPRDRFVIAIDLERSWQLS